MIKKLLLLLLFVYGTTNAQNTCSPLITNGLIGYYPFCSNANDASGNGNNGTVHGATLTTDRFGNTNSAYSFNGTSNYISVSDQASLRLSNTDFTISAWVYETSLAPAQDAIVTKRAPSGSGNGYILNIAGNNQPTPELINFQVSGGFDPHAYSGSTVLLNAWQHIVVTYTLSSQTIKIYLNGVLNSTTSGIPSPNAATSNDLWIGNDVAGGQYSFHGKIDDVFIFNRAISAAEVNSLYTNSVSTNCLIACYPFNSNANDISGYGNDGTVYGATLTTDRFGNANSAYSFNGNSDYISVADNFSLRLSNTDFTISTWIYETSAAIVQDAIITKRSTFVSGDGYILNMQGTAQPVPGLVNFQVSGGFDPNALSNDTVSMNAWQHIVVTYTLSSHTAKIYLNGILNSTTSGILSPSSTTANDLWIGHDVAGAPYSFHGKIDDIRIYTCALSDSEITVLYNGTTGINEVSDPSDFSIYPNPTNGIAFVDGIKNETVLVYNSLGAIMKEQKGEHAIDLSCFSEGIYFIRVINGNGKIVCAKKIMKQ